MSDKFFDISLNDNSVAKLIDARQTGLITEEQYIIAFAELRNRNRNKQRKFGNCLWRILELFF